MAPPPLLSSRTFVHPCKDRYDQILAMSEKCSRIREQERNRKEKARFRKHAAELGLIRFYYRRGRQMWSQLGFPAGFKMDWHWYDKTRFYPKLYLRKDRDGGLRWMTKDIVLMPDSSTNTHHWIIVPEPRQRGTPLRGRIQWVMRPIPPVILKKHFFLGLQPHRGSIDLTGGDDERSPPVNSIIDLTVCTSPIGSAIASIDRTMDILRDLPSIAKSPSDKFAVVATAVAAKEDDYAADHTAVAAVRVNEHMTFAQLGV